MQYDIVHRTRFIYASPVKESFNEARLKPVSDQQQTLDSFLLKVLPASRLRHYTDFYANIVHHFEIIEPHSTLLIESNARVTTHPLPFLDLMADIFPIARIAEATRQERCYDFLQPSSYVDLSPESWRMALDAAGQHTDAWQASLTLMHYVNQHLKYLPNSTHAHSHMREALAQRCGVCQDFAHVMIGLCRALKIPALYVSGYLATETASATHAWVEVFIPEIGWRGLDPTHNRQTDDTYVKIAVGRDYADVPPVSGHYKGTLERKLEVEVKIRSVT